MDGAHVSRRATHARRTDYPPVKTHKNQKFLLSQAFKWKKIMFFVIPEMPSKTFVMLYKKLPDHFNTYITYEYESVPKRIMMFFSFSSVVHYTFVGSVDQQPIPRLKN